MRERKRNIINFWFHLLVDYCICPDLGSNPQPWHIDNALTNRVTLPGCKGILKCQWSPGGCGSMD